MKDKIDVSKHIAYPCDKEPGIYQEGTCYRTAKSQIRIRREGKEKEVWAPSLYQSSMNPEYKEIRVLEIVIKENIWILTTRYGTCEIDCEREEIEVTNWQAEIHKTDCKKCENCGRCGW